MNPIEKLLMFFSRTVNVYITRDTFRFESGELSRSLGTYLCVETENGKHKIISVGEASNQNINLLKVELFNGTANFDKFDYFVEFLKFGLIHTTKKTAIIRPTIVCYGSNSLKEVFNGYQEGIIRRAFGEAGAVQIFMK